MVHICQSLHYITHNIVTLNTNMYTFSIVTQQQQQQQQEYSTHLAQTHICSQEVQKYSKNLIHLL
jgi:hypothetical protein